MGDGRAETVVAAYAGAAEPVGTVADAGVPAVPAAVTEAFTRGEAKRIADQSARESAAEVRAAGERA
ncbi:hypothetical protein [Streptomyces candidus]|uniref:Uncharacterized protein n=1 Tax=Streptomyces candidus TaxID=67283 RepID=A0A7X0HDU6_9ACTN|nr:hypothetical protein [Streptomyces candidus]MBB6435801.1 hypothetical protein [Streptomyces candidus]